MKIFVSAGEVSGDAMLGSVLERLRARYPDAELCGLGGAAAAACGLKPLLPLERTAVSGGWDVLRRAIFILRMYRLTMAALKRFRPDLVLLVDYPGLNLRLARRARALGLPVHYIAPPQTWAYRHSESRTRRVLRALEGCSIHVLFPFEAPVFAGSGRKITVGHFLVTEISMRPRSATDASPGNLAGDRADKPVLCLCPGSRLPVLRRNLPVWLDRLEGAGLLAASDVQILVPAHLEQEATFRLWIHQSRSGRKRSKSNAGVTWVPTIRVRTDKDAALAEADWAMAFPGTITLELALRRVPALVLAVLDPFTMAVGKKVVAAPERLGLPNLLLKQDLFPEWAGTAANLTSERFQECLNAFNSRKPAWDGVWETIGMRLEAVLGKANGAEIAAGACLATLETRELVLITG